MATGKGSHFALGIGLSGAMVVLDPQLRNVAAANEAEEVDLTVVVSQKREFEPTYERDRITLRLRANTTTLQWARDAKGLIGIDFEYGPFGMADGDPMITGTCNVLRAQSVPNAEIGTLSEIEIEINVNNEVHGVFPVIPLGARRGEEQATPRR